MPENCLIVIDMQNDFLDRLEAANRVRLVSKTNQLVDSFRASGCPIIWIKQTFKPDLSDAFLQMRDRQISIVIDGSEGAEIDPGLSRRDEDWVIVKKRYSAFFGTDFEQILRNLAPDRITIAGVNSHACIRTTAIDAYQRDIRVILASECIESHDQEHAQISMAYLEKKIAILMTNDQISDALILSSRTAPSRC
jgi:maleamate amidohydrolase